MSPVEELKEEIQRLQSELEQTTQEKVQAAEYGLAVLEEKQNLQAQYDELEGLYEKTLSEFECAKEVSKWFRGLFLPFRARTICMQLRLGVTQSLFNI